MLTGKGSSAGPELHGGRDDTALAHGLVDMSSRFVPGWTLWAGLGVTQPKCWWQPWEAGFSAVMCTKVAANGSFSLVFFSAGFPVKLVFSHFFMSLTMDTRD